MGLMLPATRVAGHSMFDIWTVFVPILSLASNPRTRHERKENKHCHDPA